MILSINYEFMSTSVQHFICKFENGESCDLRFDLSDSIPIISASNKRIAPENEEVYKRWIRDVVLPNIDPHLTLEQRLFFALAGEIRLLMANLRKTK